MYVRSAELSACHYCKMMMIITTAPRPTPTTTHRAQLCINGLIEDTDIIIILLIGSVLFYHFIYRLIHCSLCNVACILGSSSDIFEGQLNVSWVANLVLFYSLQDVV